MDVPFSVEVLLFKFNGLGKNHKLNLNNFVTGPLTALICQVILNDQNKVIDWHFHEMWLKRQSYWEVCVVFGAMQVPQHKVSSADNTGRMEVNFTG